MYLQLQLYLELLLVFLILNVCKYHIEIQQIAFSIANGEKPNVTSSYSLGLELSSFTYLMN